MGKVRKDIFATHEEITNFLPPRLAAARLQEGQ